MSFPTHIRITVQRAKQILIKGKHGKNDCFVVIKLGKEKYQTSTKEKSLKHVEWHEECDLKIPPWGNTADITLTVLNKNFLGDQFLGRVSIPLSGLDAYEGPVSRWYKLDGILGKMNTKNRGDIEVTIDFIVKDANGKTYFNPQLENVLLAAP